MPCPSDYPDHPSFAMAWTDYLEIRGYMNAQKAFETKLNIQQTYKSVELTQRNPGVAPSLISSRSSSSVEAFQACNAYISCQFQADPSIADEDQLFSLRPSTPPDQSSEPDDEPLRQIDITVDIPPCVIEDSRLRVFAHAVPPDTSPFHYPKGCEYYDIDLTEDLDPLDDGEDPDENPGDGENEPDEGSQSHCSHYGDQEMYDDGNASDGNASDPESTPYSDGGN
jgi:hypothetical protein